MEARIPLPADGWGPAKTDQFVLLTRGVSGLQRSTTAAGSPLTYQ
jgi:hypothetical protein